MSSVWTFSPIATGEATGGCDCILAISCPRPLCSAVRADCAPVLFGRILTEAGRASSRGRGTGASKLVARTVSELEGRLWWAADCAVAVRGGGASGTKGCSLNNQDRCWLRLLLPMLSAVNACMGCSIRSVPRVDRHWIVTLLCLYALCFAPEIISILVQHRLGVSRSGLTRLVCCSRDSPPSFAQKRDPLLRL